MAHIMYLVQAYTTVHVYTRYNVEGCLGDLPMEGYVPTMKVAHDYAATVMCHRFGTGKK